MFFKSARRVCNHLNFNSIKKKLFPKRISSSKGCFLNFEPNNCEVIENSSKAPLNFSPLKCTYLGEIISISLALCQKNEIEKWPLRTSVQCTVQKLPVQMIFKI